MWGLQVLIRVEGEPGRLPYNEWRWVHPSGGAPYQYETKAEAERMLGLIGDVTTQRRVAEFV